METKEAIIHYCRYQERCHSEVKTKLYELGCTKITEDEYMLMLLQMDLLNEERFARSFARGKFNLLKWGKVKIKQQLKFRKISDYLINKALTEIDSVRYEHIIRQLAERKLHELRNEKALQSKKLKLFRYLIQKGFERDIVSSIVSEFVE